MRLHPGKRPGDYAIRWELGDNGYYVRFAITSACHSAGDGADMHYGTGVDDAIADLATAPAKFHGTVKWDGCVNWDGEEDCMSHNCGASGLRELFAAIMMAHRVALEMMGDKADRHAVASRRDPSHRRGSGRSNG